MVQGKFFGSENLLAPDERNSWGTFLALRYFWTAEFAAVPLELKTTRTSSCSTSLRVCSTVLGGVNASSREISFILRPLTPPSELSFSKKPNWTRPAEL